jgi:hypothetical protein
MITNICIRQWRHPGNGCCATASLYADVDFKDLKKVSFYNFTYKQWDAMGRYSHYVFEGEKEEFDVIQSILSGEHDIFHYVVEERGNIRSAIDNYVSLLYSSYLQNKKEMVL